MEPRIPPGAITLHMRLHGVTPGELAYVDSIRYGEGRFLRCNQVRCDRYEERALHAYVRILSGDFANSVTRGSSVLSPMAAVLLGYGYIIGVFLPSAKTRKILLLHREENGRDYLYFNVVRIDNWGPSDETGGILSVHTFVDLLSNFNVFGFIFRNWFDIFNHICAIDNFQHRI